MFYIVILVLVIVIFVLYKKHLKIDLFSFFKKGFKSKENNGGIYIYTGKQGYGKTYCLVKFLLSFKNKIPIYSNVKLNNINFTEFQGYNQLISLGNSKKNCIIVFDEIFSILNKSEKLQKEFMTFISQLRKNNIIFISTAQEWLEIPITLRRYCKHVIQCKKILFLGKFPIFIEKVGSGYDMVYDKDTSEYICPIIATNIHKGLRKVANSYDTFQVINHS